MAEGLKGGKQLQALLAKLHAEAEAAGREALKTWAEDVKEDAQAATPMETGYLRSHIGDRVKGLVAQVGVWDRQAYYSVFVENGTSRQTAQPFLGPAFDRRRDITPYLRASIKKRFPG